MDDLGRGEALGSGLHFEGCALNVMSGGAVLMILGRFGAFFCGFCTFFVIEFIPYNDYLVYLHPKYFKFMAKVIHVHLLVPIEGTKQRDWYFSSITAVYSVLTAEQVGASRSYLLHAGLSGNGTVCTKRAIIKQSTLISGGR